MNSNQSNQSKSSYRILTSHPDTGTLRLVRDSISNLLDIEIDTSPSPEYAFELSIKRPYSLFIFGINMPNLKGPLLYDMLCLVYSKVHENEPQFPPVIFIGDESDNNKTEELKKDARVKSVLYRPLSIERLISVAKEAMHIQ